MPILLTLEHFLKHGLPPSAIARAGRPVQEVIPGSSEVVAPGHYVLSGDLVTFQAQGTMPQGLATGTVYEAERTDMERFRLKYTLGPLAGQVVDITTAGVPPITYKVDPRPVIEAELAAAWTVVENSATAHGTLEEVPQQLIADACVIAAYNLVVMSRLQHTLNEQGVANLKERASYAHARCKENKTGMPIKGVKDGNAVAEMGARVGLAAENGPSMWEVFL